MYRFLTIAQASVLPQRVNSKQERGSPSGPSVVGRAPGSLKLDPPLIVKTVTTVKSNGLERVNNQHTQTFYVSCTTNLFNPRLHE